jgi:hypothetical protein
MSLMSSTGERLRRATGLWHAYLAGTGKRFELAQFLKDEALERQILATALASRHPALVKLAQEWLRDCGEAVPATGPHVVPAAGGAAATAPATPPEAPKPARYLRGVR